MVNYRFVVLLLLLLPNTVSAGIIFIPVDHNPPPPVDGGGCTPPIEFIKEHQCTLSRSPYSSDINVWDCGRFKVWGDCAGGILGVKELMSEEEARNQAVVLSSMTSAFAIAAVLFFFFLFCYILYKGVRG